MIENGEFRDDVFYPNVGTRWKMYCEWKGRPFPQQGTWTYTVKKIDGEWITVLLSSFGEAGIETAMIKVQAWNPNGYKSPKGHQVWFRAA